MQHPFTVTILNWFSVHRRDLPWRGLADPYPIWLSEVILQQTRIRQGLDYWVRFMRRFPTVEALASATEDEVLLLWQGLGYYSRARHLHAAARQIVALGGFPTTYRGIRELKGVGDYTAAAVGSMAFGLPVAAVDGNVFRVLSRVFGIDVPINTTSGKKTFTDLAQRLLPTRRSGDFNQALMDFGAMQCVPSSPHCGDCPLLALCVARQSGRVNELPVKKKTVTVKTRRLQYVYIRCDGQVAIHRRGSGDIWQGLWEPLLLEDAPWPEWEGTLTKMRQNVKHVLTHRILLADFYLLETDVRPSLPDDYIWIDEADMDKYAMPRLVELLLDSL